MSSAPLMPPYLNHRADQAVFKQAPMLMVPRAGQLPAVNFYQRRYLAANDGIYLQALIPGLHVCARLAQVPLPYGRLPSGGPFVQMEGDGVSGEFWRTILDQAVSRCPREMATLVAWRKSTRSYLLIFPKVASASGAHVTYEEISGDDDLELVVDVHSHGRGRAFFSSVDDRSDRMRIGPHISIVLGRCDSVDHIEASVRLCIGHHLIPLDFLPFEGADNHILVVRDVS